MPPDTSLEAPSLKLFSSSAEVVKIFQPLKAIMSKNVKKKRALADSLATSATKETLSKLFSLLKKTLRAKWNIL